MHRYLPITVMLDVLVSCIWALPASATRIQVNGGVGTESNGALRCTPSSRPKLAPDKLSHVPLITPFRYIRMLASDSPEPGATAYGCRT